MVHAQPGIVGTLLQEAWTGPRGLCHCQKTLTAWLACLPPSRTSPSDIPAPSHPPVWCRPYGPQQGNAHEDGRLLAPSPTLGFELFQINPNTYPSSRILHSSSVSHCPTQATYGCPQTSLRRPHSHPCSCQLCPTFPSLLKYRAPDSHRGLCTLLPPNVMPLSWKTNRPHSKVRSHLPVAELANIARPIFGTLSFGPLERADLRPEAPLLLPHDTMTNAYRALKGRTRLVLLEEWRRLAPSPGTTPSHCP